ncbi:hypothetical protein COO60DRAFT_253222 [Scenedesmus sp. NREL 46B-D3]|nr:hypothetical protein COO60DRAFT_253222 [Scenedesmus sp. NREL 46B-D3]
MKMLPGIGVPVAMSPCCLSRHHPGLPQSETSCDTGENSPLLALQAFKGLLRSCQSYPTTHAGSRTCPEHELTLHNLPNAPSHDMHCQHALPAHKTSVTQTKSQHTAHTFSITLYAKHALSTTTYHPACKVVRLITMHTPLCKELQHMQRTWGADSSAATGQAVLLHQQLAAQVLAKGTLCNAAP